ncbi:MAG TPA: SDR family oxidoreductase [Bacteroidia bacterium]|nr:SDR family oxidoreductase [Bacteroidia bacterium]
MKKFSLDNLTILITGASSGIGRSCAVEASLQGAHCILVARNKAELEKTASLCKNKTDILVADLTNEEDVKKLIEQVPKLNGTVNCAGIISPRPVSFLKRKNLEEVFNINYFAAVLLTAGLLHAKKMQESASFVFISSISSQHPYFGAAAYASSKAALESFSKTLALEIAPKKMRSNVLLPGMVKTQMMQETKEAVGEENFKNYEKNYPLGFGEVEDVANAVCFLLSTEARWITGSELKMDGGLMLSGIK